MIYGDRVRQVRELYGLTQAELAESVEASQSSIALIESGQRAPSEKLLEAIALRTGFPPSFFETPPLGGFPIGTLQYRALKRALKSPIKEQLHRRAELYRETAETMLRRVNPLPLHLPQTLTEDPTSAAAITRSALGLSPDTPIAHLTHVLERAGVLILAMPVAVDGLDAFSCWPDPGSSPDPNARRPVVAVTQQPHGDRLRFSVAHEIAHLVLHHPPRGTVAEMEREADLFAAALLLPETAIQAEIVPPVTLVSLAALKPRWRVSIQMLIVNAHERGIVSERQYRYLYQQLTTRGWRTAEPENLHVPPEKPRAVRKMAELLYGAPPNIKRLADDVRQPENFVAEMIEAHADRSGLPARSAIGASSKSGKLVVFPGGRGE